MRQNPQVLWVGVPAVVDVVDCEQAETAEAARRLLGDRRFDLVIAAVEASAEAYPLLDSLLPSDTAVAIFHPQATPRDAVDYLHLGAVDVATDQESLSRVLENYRRLGLREESEQPWRNTLVGDSAAMSSVLRRIQLAGPRRSTVLITGESGTGKELVARALHLASPRAHLPMVTVNAAALPEHLLEAELFGHVKGAFTGAFQQRIGRFEQAHRSTLFLDEIGDLPLPVQTKLLRFLQERELQRIGSSETLRVDVRLIAATNVDLPGRIREGKFREDLYYRLNVIPLLTPPLRERLEDIVLLARHFAAKVCRAEEIPLKRLSPEAEARLTGFSWPGNIRQLENAVEMAVVLAGSRDWIAPADFAETLGTGRPVVPVQEGGIAVPLTGLDYERTVGSIEKQILEDALRKANGNKTAAAELLGLKRTTLSAKLRSLGAAAS